MWTLEGLVLIFKYSAGTGYEFCSLLCGREHTDVCFEIVQILYRCCWETSMRPVHTHMGNHIREEEALLIMRRSTSHYIYIINPKSRQLPVPCSPDRDTEPVLPLWCEFSYDTTITGLHWFNYTIAEVAPTVPLSMMRSACLLSPILNMYLNMPFQERIYPARISPP